MWGNEDEENCLDRFLIFPHDTLQVKHLFRLSHETTQKLLARSCCTKKKNIFIVLHDCCAWRIGSAISSLFKKFRNL
jgi:hypothetical protein